MERDEISNLRDLVSPPVRSICFADAASSSASASIRPTKPEP